jgi:hypothetical protein
MGGISYEEFGVNFVTKVVTPERVAETIARVSGAEVKAGPMSAGPGGAASVLATGRIGAVTARPTFNKQGLAFEALIPIDLKLGVKVAGVTHRYNGVVRVRLHLGIRAEPPVKIMIDVDPVAVSDVDVELAADGLRARVLQRLGNVDEEVRRAVASVVSERLDSDAARAVRELDILGYVDQAWNQ